MTNEPMFNLSALANQLLKEKRQLPLARKIKVAVDFSSRQVDLLMARDACDALQFSLDRPMNQPPQFREASEIALLSHVVLLYARATKTSSTSRSQYDPRDLLNPEERRVHKELCDLRDDAVAHFGKGGSYAGLWVEEVLVLDMEAARVAIITQRQIVDRQLLARARSHISRVLELLEPRARRAIDVVTEALNVEFADPNVRAVVQRHLLDTQIFGGDERVDSLRHRARQQGRARNSFGADEAVVLKQDPEGSASS